MQFIKSLLDLIGSIMFICNQLFPSLINCIKSTLIDIQFSFKCLMLLQFSLQICWILKDMIVVNKRHLPEIIWNLNNFFTQYFLIIYWYKLFLMDSTLQFTSKASIKIRHLVNFFAYLAKCSCMRQLRIVSLVLRHAHIVYVLWFN